MSYDAKCPKCGQANKIDLSDGYKEGEVYEMECGECLTLFYFTMRVLVIISTSAKGNNHVDQV